MPKKKKKKNQFFRVQFERKVVDSFIVEAPSRHAVSLWASEASESEEIRELIEETDHEREFNCEQPELVCAKIEPLEPRKNSPIYPTVIVDNFGQEVPEDENADNTSDVERL